MKRIPPEYRPFTLETLKPDPVRYENQSDLIDYIRSHPDESFLFAGKPGRGKSLLSWLLYRCAIERDRPVIALPLAELLLQFRRYELSLSNHGKYPALPSISADSVRDDRRRWFIFIDEFDKARPSEFAAEQLFALLDAVYTYQHQLVITTNLEAADLRAHWARASDQYGTSIMRRALELEGMNYVPMFE